MPISFYCIGSVVGPHPFPMMIRDFQSITGIEARQQMLDEIGKLPDNVIACIGGGSNAIGIFSGFIADDLCFRKSITRIKKVPRSLSILSMRLGHVKS